MSKYHQVEAIVDVPRNAGLGGFLYAVKAVLRYARVTDLHINTKGQIRFVRHVREDEAAIPAQIDFESVTAATVIKASRLTEVAPAGESEPAPVAVARMFAAAAADHVAPVAFVVGAGSPFAAWHLESSGVAVGETAYGVPVLEDERVPAEALVLCASYSAGGTLGDVQRCYKLALPQGAL